ncbi:MAG: sialate O-acetylesterase [Armatimonadota bacterium]
MNRYTQTCIAIVATILFSAHIMADVSLSPLFSNGMVIQRNTPVTIWGTASRGEKISVSVNDQQVNTICTDNRWSVKLKQMPAGGPYTLSVSGNNQVNITDVYIGEVWLLCGDENLSVAVLKTSDYASYVNSASDASLHLLSVSADRLDKQNQTRPTWMSAQNLFAANISAIGYFYGRQLRQQLNVPVGIIVASADNSSIIQWMSPRAKTSISSFAKGRISRVDQSALYNNLLAPLVPYTIKGVVWYQGKADIIDAYRYRYYLAELIKGWRADWGSNDLPFLVVLLPSESEATSSLSIDDSLWAEMRDSQSTVARITKYTTLVNIIDLTDLPDSIPQYKKLIAQRIALTAINKHYKLAVDYTGPQFSQMALMGNQAMVSFTNTNGGLEGRSGTVRDFFIAGSDRIWYPADAFVVGDRVWASSVYVSMPVAVRFGWADSPDINLYNGAGFPAMPFRSDKWPLSSQPSSIK